VKGLLHDQLQEILSALQAFEDGELAQFNAMLAERGVAVAAGTGAP
jgi:hypothetical protein